jgi:hypothetical protein
LQWLYSKHSDHEITLATIATNATITTIVFTATAITEIIAITTSIEIMKIIAFQCSNPSQPEKKREYLFTDFFSRKTLPQSHQSIKFVDVNIPIRRSIPALLEKY